MSPIFHSFLILQQFLLHHYRRSVLHSPIVKCRMCNRSRVSNLLAALLLLWGLTARDVDAFLFGWSLNDLSHMVGDCTDPCVPGDESIMDNQDALRVQETLRWNCDTKVADRICNHNRRYAEFSGYWELRPEFLLEIEKARERNTEIIFYDSNTGNPLFMAPKDRSWDEFLEESRNHGWPSFRDSEVNWEYVRVLGDGETVSVNGTHLGHNLPDSKGRRYCINLVSIAGFPLEEKEL